MPIVEVEIVTDDAPAADMADRLAVAIGDALSAEPGRTWVRLRCLPRNCYGESGGALPDRVTPVFVTISARRHPEPEDFEDAAAAVCHAVAAITGTAPTNVHVLFGQDARGRVAFGGTLVPE